MAAQKSIWRGFEWIPERLLEKWVLGVKTKHERYGWQSLPGILWDTDTMTFIGCHENLRHALEVTTKTWSPKKANEYRTYLASIILAIESLGCDFAGWGTRFPEARHEATEILDAFFSNNRTRLLDVYMPLRNQLDQAQLKQVLGPPG
jgi:hypothetical protein